MCKTAQKRTSLDTIGISRLPDQKKIKERYLKKRAAKAITSAAMYRLFGLQSPLNDDYRQAYRCNDYLFQNGNWVTSNYCKKRCCTICSRIKSAQSLCKYAEPILGLNDLYLVTLTNKNVHADLSDEVDRMFSALSRIKKNIGKNYKDRKLNGYRSFECTYSLKKGFNPHFHFIVSGKESAKLLIDLWLKQFPDATIKAQDMKRVRNTKESLLEVFKYIAKPITKGYYSAKAYDEIMRSIKNRRVSDPLGTVRGYTKENSIGIDLDLDTIKATVIDFKGNRIEVWKYSAELYDYVSPDGELFLGTPIDKKTLNSINVIKKSEYVQKGEYKTEQRIMYENRGRKDYVF